MRVSIAQVLYDQEVRGVWVTNVDSDILFSKSSIAAGMDYLAENGVNVVYPVVWNKGFTLYPSPVLLAATGVAQDPIFAQSGRDPLAELVVEAHRNGMEVVPWFEYGFATSFSQSGGHIIAANPDWAAMNNQGQLVVKNGFDWMNGLHPGPQELMLSLIEEVLTKYDVDGVQGDDRLPAMPIEAGYSDYTKKLYRDEHGGQDPPSDPRNFAWQDWRARKLTAFAGELYRRVKDANPSAQVVLSPSIWPFSVNEYLQDWPVWIDSGYVDIVHPQAYPPPPRSVSQYQTIISNMVGPTPGSVFGYIPPEQRHLIFPGMLVKAGSDLVDPARVASMIDFHRGLGLNGESFFFFEGMGSKNQFLADTLRKYFYDSPAILPGRTSLWRPPAAVVNKDDDGATLTGTWTSDAAAPGFDGPMVFATAGSGATAAYELSVPTGAYYDIYAFVPRFRGGVTNSANYHVESGATSETAIVNQSNTRLEGWIRLTTLEVQQADGVTVTIDPDAVTDGGTTYADAVMALLNRKLSPEAVIEIAVVGTDNAAEELPASAQIGSTYPNPFSRFTTIPVTLRRPSSVRLDVIDLLGRVVAEVLPETALPPGEHALQLDAGSLSSGVYIIRVRVNGRSEARTVTLVR
jgi:uncharacterized lipoprotein YddW (UPF0748 family)